MEVYITTRKVEKVTIDDKILEKILQERSHKDNYLVATTEDINEDIREYLWSSRDCEALIKKGIVEEVDSHEAVYSTFDEAYEDMEFGIH